MNEKFDCSDVYNSGLASALVIRGLDKDSLIEKMKNISTKGECRYEQLFIGNFSLESLKTYYDRHFKGLTVDLISQTDQDGCRDYWLTFYWGPPPVEIYKHK
jgi:hypothetical protein